MADNLPGIRPTPERYPTLNMLARALKAADQFGRAPFGYSNPPVEMLSDVLQVPQLARTLENAAYGSPLTRGTGQARQLTPDTQGALEAVSNLAPGVAPAARLAIKGARASAPYAARHAVNLTEKYGVSPMMNVIKPKGGNWLEGSVEEAVKPLKSPDAVRQGGNTITLEQALDFPGLTEAAERDLAINRWLDTKLSKYMRNEMGTLEDPLRALAGKGVTHIPNKEDLLMSADWIPDEVADLRRAAGYPEEATSNMIHAERGYPADEEELARLAAGWENLADSAIIPSKVGKLLSEPGKLYSRNNPWLSKLDPETMVYTADKQGDLGFSHLIDELKNAMNPESGLPRHLQLDTDKIDKITVPQASELVAKINAWRAEQKIAADAEKANNAATVLHKEYPEQGYKWVELKAPEGTSSAYLGNKQFESPEANALQDALKYEGETMGHCVGGYCPDVLEGRSRIFSLRDKKGEPHVTIEVKPGAFSSPEEALKYEQEPENGLSRIIQIKGKANMAPKKDYLPFVQDFVRSGKWGDVGDLQNTGLHRVIAGQRLPGFSKEIEPGYYSLEDFNKMAVENEMPQEILDSWMNKLKNPRNYAEGGAVEFDPARIDEIAQGLRNYEYEAEPVGEKPKEFASGGFVEYNPAEIENAVARLREDMYA